MHKRGTNYDDFFAVLKGVIKEIKKDYVYKGKVGIVRYTYIFDKVTSNIFVFLL